MEEKEKNEKYEPNKSIDGICQVDTKGVACKEKSSHHVIIGFNIYELCEKHYHDFLKKQN